MPTRGIAVFAALSLLAGTAAAQGSDGQEVDIEIPVLILDTAPDLPEPADERLDLANVVLTAAKGVSTVQEAPAIVTVIPSWELDDAGHATLEDVLDTVPGWMRHDAIYNQFPFVLTRGTVQATLYMQDGLSLFDPWGNVPQVGRIVPLETIKRIEVITGPGGVLWGANSFLGVLNVITKTAADVDGVEAEITIGDGPGDRGLFRAYAMTGVEDVVGTGASVFLHASVESYRGPEFSLPNHLFSAPLPAPNSMAIYGPLVDSQVDRSTLVNLDGSITAGDVTVRFSAPFVERHQPLGFGGTVIRRDLPEDRLDECAPVEPLLASGDVNPDAMRTSDRCSDRARVGRQNRADWFDRYVTAEYRTRYDDEASGFVARAYAVEFVRGFQQLQLMAPSPGLLEGGLAFEADTTSYRAGGAVDGDLAVTDSVRLLYGAEAFREWLPNNVENARQRVGDGEPAGLEARFVAPLDLTRLPLPCPIMPDPDGGTMFVPQCPITLVFQTDRAVLGAYANPRWRATRRLALDIGARTQAAPDALGKASYPLQLTFSGAAVYGLNERWHLKLNYAEGFRAPVFNNTDSNGEAAQLDGRRDLELETSRAVQTEINARVLRNVRALREVNLRADYSYTQLENLIQVVGGRYDNTGERGIHSAELLVRAFFDGDHRVQLAYTWLDVSMADRGAMRAVPEHWFNVGGVFSLNARLQLSTTVRVMGAFEDPNRLVEHRRAFEDPFETDTGGSMSTTITVQPHELVRDRIPPAGELQAGLIWRLTDALRLRAFAYNAFNTRHYNPDTFQEYEPRIESVPNPYPDYRFVVGLRYGSR